MLSFQQICTPTAHTHILVMASGLVCTVLCNQQIKSTLKHTTQMTLRAPIEALRITNRFTFYACNELIAMVLQFYLGWVFFWGKTANK
jgi:hypothetical protein